MIRGPLPISLCIVFGLLASWFAESPKKYLRDGLDAINPVTRPWWTLDKRLRLAIVGGCIWIVGAYMIQESYEENLGIVFIPVIAILVLHFGVKIMVENNGNRQHAECSSSSAPKTKFPTTFNLNDAPLTSPSASSEITLKKNLADYPYGIALVNGQYHFGSYRYDNLKDAIAYAELIQKRKLATQPTPTSPTNILDVYEVIASEFANNTIDHGLWIRLFAECDGDEIRTKVRYIKERAIKLNK